mmetsp:Transcript_61830/g.160592  ORF Transcript_61830/g.160592 Transcript_61830/m.160592 type:complete len:96 (+) Transcript_61830:171-458(+)
MTTTITFLTSLGLYPGRLLASILVLFMCVCTTAGASVAADWPEMAAEEPATLLEKDCARSARMKMFTVASVGFVAGGALTISHGSPVASAMIVGF